MPTRNSLDEEIADHLRDKPAGLGLGILGGERGEIEVFLGEPFERGMGDDAELLRADIVGDPGGDVVFLGLLGVHVAEHLLKHVRREDLANDVEDVIGAELVADRVEAFLERREDAPLAGVGGDEVEDQAVVLLAVAVDSANPLLEADGAPGDVVIDHQPAELEVDPLASGLGGDKHLDALAKLPFCVDASAGGVAVADLHAAMDLGERQAPLAELPDRAPILAVAGEVVERVLVLGEDQQLHLRIVEDAFVLDERLEHGELGLLLAGLDVAGLGDELREIGNLLAEDRRLVGEHLRLDLGEDLLLFLLVVVVDVVGHAGLDLLLPMLLRVGEDPLAALLHSFERSADGIDARRHPPLEHRHLEADGPAAGGAVARGGDGLILHVVGERVVNIELLGRELEIGRPDFSVAVELVGMASVGIGEGRQGLLDPPQVERSGLRRHRRLKALDVAVDVFVEEGEEPSEMLRVALVRRGRHEEIVVGHLRKGPTEAVGVGRVVVVAGAHLVGLVDDDEIPPRTEQALTGVFLDRRPGDARDDLVILLPGVLAVVGPERGPADELELLAELVRHFALPLKGEIRRSDDQDPLGEAPGLELLDEEAGHYRLAGPGIVGEQEADPGKLEEILVDRFELMGERIDAGDREGEERVVFMGEAEPVRLNAEPESAGIAVKGNAIGEHLERGNLISGEDRVVGRAGSTADPHDPHRGAHRRDGVDLHRLRQGRAGDRRARLKRGGWGHGSVLFQLGRSNPLRPLPKLIAKKIQQLIGREIDEIVGLFELANASREPIAEIARAGRRAGNSWLDRIP